MGAMLGSAYGAIAHDALPHLAAAAGAYGLVGMGAVFAASARAPITAVLIIFELTGDYRVILPLMIAVVVATAIANAATRDTIYTLKLRRRGIDIDAPAPSSLMAQITVGEALGELPRPLDPDQPLRELLDRFAASRTNALPVIDADGTLLGVVSAGDVEHALANSPGDTTARTLIHETPELRVDQTLEDAVWRLGSSDDEGLPVLGQDGKRVVGWLTHRQLLSAYRKQLGENDPRSGQAGRDAPRAPP
jgi:CIC family chloride channel protein